MPIGSLSSYLFYSGLFLFLETNAALSKWTALPRLPIIQVSEDQLMLTSVDQLTIRDQVVDVALDLNVGLVLLCLFILASLH